MKYRPGWEDGKPVRCRPLRPPVRLDACRCHCSPAARCPRSPQPYARHVTGDKIVSSIRHVKALPCQRRPSPRPRQPPRRRHHRLRRGLAPPAAVSNAAGLADRYYGGRRCFSSAMARSRLAPVFASARGMAASPSAPSAGEELDRGDRVRPWLPPPPRPTPAWTTGRAANRITCKRIK